MANSVTRLASAAPLAPKLMIYKNKNNKARFIMPPDIYILEKYLSNLKGSRHKFASMFAAGMINNSGDNILKIASDSLNLLPNSTITMKLEKVKMIKKDKKVTMNVKTNSFLRFCTAFCLDSIATFEIYG